MIGDVPDLIAKRALLTPHAVALEDVRAGRLIGYGELNERASRSAALIAARGVAEGDRIALLCRNRIEFFELLFACAKLGAILVPLNWRMPPAELDGLIADCAPALLFHGAEDADAVRALSAPPPLIALDGDYPALRDAAVPAPSRDHWPAASIWYLLYTSGTTGRPKGVIYTYRMALSNFVNIGTAIGITAADATANFLPLFHTAGINLHSLPTLIAGGRVLVLPGVDAEALVRLFEGRRIDTFFAVPTVYQTLLDHPRFAAAPLGHVRHWGCGGAPLPDVLVERYRHLGVRVCNGMGMTETGPTAFLMDRDDAWERVGSVGKPQLLCSVRIVGFDGRDVAPGEVGDLLFGGPAVTPGYWRNEDATRAAFTEDGWLRSGDLARRDPDGFYYIAGRRKDMFISGGENVYPAEVENVLCAHPAVADVAVVGAPHPTWGEAGRAFIQLASGTLPPAADELRSFCRSRLAPYKVPLSFEYVREFPRTSAGKIQKHLLLPGERPGRAAGR
ncbi:MAG: class I adenylate-forming enzyme family protein [Allosphingosinicella sp.]|uniref:class I adenylate-forming enzyme family protein n=1 Tax=Allosphingosinicella sp. TaxID=2823234 RepID=UPI00395F941F